MSFSEAEESLLISSVAKHPVLYDKNHEDYSNGLLKKYVWKDIAEELNKSSEDCRRKWRFVRDGYYRFKKKNKSVSIVPTSKNSKNERHKLLEFLEKSTVAAAPPNEVTNTDEASAFSSIFIASCGNEDDKQDLCSETSKSQNEDMTTETLKIDDEDYDETEVAIDKVIKEKTAQFRLKRQKRLFNKEFRAKAWNKRHEKRQRVLKVEVKQKDDHIDLFCRHIAEVLRSLPPVYKAEAKKQLGAVVSDYEIMAATGTVPPNMFKKSNQNSSVADEELS